MVFIYFLLHIAFLIWLLPAKLLIPSIGPQKNRAELKHKLFCQNYLPYIYQEFFVGFIFAEFVTSLKLPTLCKIDTAKNKTYFMSSLVFL